MRLVTRMVLTLAAGLGLAAAAAAQEMPPLPKPGPEHELLKMDAGTWDAVVEIKGADGMTMTSKGVETSTMGCGGLCLISQFEAEMMPGMAFQGHGLTTYDTSKKKYVGTWMDSMSTGLSHSESTYDPATRRATGMMEGPDMTGTVTKSKTVVEYPDADHRVMTMYSLVGGKEVETMKITYTRRK